MFCKVCKQGYHIGDCLPESAISNNMSVSEFSVNPSRVAGARWDEASKIAIQVTTKPCPKCRTATERAGGCMHMVKLPDLHYTDLKLMNFINFQACTRAGCNFEWCWICQTEWTRDCMAAHWFG